MKSMRTVKILLRKTKKTLNNNKRRTAYDSFIYNIAVVAVIMLLLLIPADCILEFSYNNKENNGSVIIKYAFLKFKIFPNDKVEEEVENEEETTDKEEKQKNRIF